jgi:folate-dependent tRNA-U54 methylase TrmFO/GidA
MKPITIVGGGLAGLTLGIALRREGVPVTIWEPPAWVENLDAGEEVVVVGLVRRRFFRTAQGMSGARAEVEAAHVTRPTARGLAAALRRAEGALDGLA